MLWWLLQNTLTVAALVAIVALFCRLVQCRPAVQHALWAVVLLKFLTPAIVAWPWQLDSLFATFLPAPAQTQVGSNETHGYAPRALTASSEEANLAFVPPEDPAFGHGDALSAWLEVQNEAPQPWWKQPWPEELPTRVDTDQVDVLTSDSASIHPQLSTARAELPQYATPVETIAPVPAPEAARTSILENWRHGVLALWLCGGMACAFWQIWRIVRCHRKISRARPAPHWLTDGVQGVAATLGVKPPRTLVVAGIRSPFVWCLGRPKLLWPESLAERDGRHNAQRWLGVIAHELAHLKRRDHWLAWIELIAACIWWWNPLFWYVRRRLRDAAELACDAWAVWAVPGGERTYAESLLTVAQLLSETAAPAPALAVSTDARRSFERRLSMILSQRVSCRLSWFGVLAVVLLAMLAFPAWSLGQADGPPVPNGSNSDSKAVDAPSNQATEAAPDKPSRPPNPNQEGTAEDKPPAPDTKPVDPDPKRLPPTGAGADDAPAADPNDPRRNAANPAVRMSRTRAADAIPSSDDRIARLEEQLSALLKEVRSMRSEQRADLRPNQRRVLTADEHGRVHLELREGEKLVSGSTVEAKQVPYNLQPGESIVLRIDEDGNLRQDRWKGEKLLRTEILPQTGARTSAVAAPPTTRATSPDGKTVAIVGQDGTVCLLDAETGKQLSRTIGVSPIAKSVAFSPDGKHLTVIGSDGNVSELDPRTGATLRAIITSSGVGTGGTAATSGVGRSGTALAPASAETSALSPGSVGESSAGPTVAATPTTGAVYGRYPSPPSSDTAHATSSAGAQLDLIRLATEYSEAVGAAKLAQRQWDRIRPIKDQGVVSQEEVAAAEVKLETSAHKVRLLRAIAESALEATKAELEHVQKLAEKGYASPGAVAQGRSKLKILEMILGEDGGARK